MKTELLYLNLVSAFTGPLWLPSILDRIAVRGLIDAVGYPESQHRRDRDGEHGLSLDPLVHAAAYTLAVPWVRTLAFAAGFFAQAVIASQLLGR